MDATKKFNVRVYALIINENFELLITDELYSNFYMTKFPGGGLEFGESTIDCLKREAIEEMQQEIEVIEHFYTSDFVQFSILNKNQQVICIYFFAQFKDKIKFKISTQKYDFDEVKEGAICFRNVKIDDLNEEDFTFESDKIVLRKLKELLEID